MPFRRPLARSFALLALCLLAACDGQGTAGKEIGDAGSGPVTGSSGPGDSGGAGSGSGSGSGGSGTGSGGSGSGSGSGGAGSPTLPNPATSIGVLFVTQVPVKSFQSVAATFGAHQPSLDQTPRGGDLYIRYNDGTLRNLTREAGYGLATNSQDDTSSGPRPIAVRQPVVHWSGAKALFSMVVGAASRQYEVKTYRWQLFEVTGLGKGQAVAIKKVCGAAQPAYNNIAPAYTSDDQIIYVSDRPRNGAAQLYPQRDEYESAPIDTGLWKLDPVSCNFKLLQHAVSGVSYPSIDSFGRVIFTRWDHLQRDQQADADQFEKGTSGTFNYDNEDQTAVPAVHSRMEFFPELRQRKYASVDGESVPAGYPLAGHTFNQFFPWMLNQDGSDEETVNHVGRHEIGGTYTDGSFVADKNLTYLTACDSSKQYCLRGDSGIFHMREDPMHPGRYYGTVAPEFGTATSGDLVYLDGAPSTNPDSMKVIQIGESGDDDKHPEIGVGRMRNPLMLSSGVLIAAHAPERGDENSLGATSHYGFRLRMLTPGATAATLGLGTYLTSGLSRCVDYWSPDARRSWCGTLWELDPAEVLVRPAPAKTAEGNLPAPEQTQLTAQGVDENLLKRWLHSRSLALIVSRDVTTRDRHDLQQPYNLEVAGTSKQTRASGSAGSGTLYGISHMTIYQADQIRGYASPTTPQKGGAVSAGRRPLAVPLHDTAAVTAMGAAFSSAAGVPIADDGSMAAFVPAGRATTWQLVDSSKAVSNPARSVVKERNWLSFKPGERRVCASCHGVNTKDQAGDAAPTNSPKALGNLLAQWKGVVRNGCAATGGTGAWSYSGVAFSGCDEGEQYRIQTCQGGNGCCNGMPASEAKACP